MSHLLINVGRFCTSRQDGIMVDGESTSANAVNPDFISIPTTIPGINTNFSEYCPQQQQNDSDL